MLSRSPKASQSHKESSLSIFCLVRLITRARLKRNFDTGLDVVGQGDAKPHKSNRQKITLFVLFVPGSKSWDRHKENILLINKCSNRFVWKSNSCSAKMSANLRKWKRFVLNVKMSYNHNGRFPMALTEQLKLFVRCNNIFIRSIVIISNYVI